MARSVGVNVAAEEITERKRTEAALRASELQFHTLADFIPQLVWMAEANGRIFWFNSQWYEYTGEPTGDGRVHDWQAFSPPLRCRMPTAAGRSPFKPERRWRWSCHCLERTDNIVHS